MLLVSRQILTNEQYKMSGERKLYCFLLSPPSRAVLLTLKALDLDFKVIAVNTILGEQHKPEILARNPQHAVPILEEADGTCLLDSHAICAYLVRRYGKDDSLYPKDFYQRALVDQRLHFENGVMFLDCFLKTIAPVRARSISKAEFQERVNKLHETYDLLETFLGDNQFMAGNSLTIADFSIVSSFRALTFAAPINENKWPKLTAWLERISQLPYYGAASTKGLEAVESIFKENIPHLQ